MCSIVNAAAVVLDLPSEAVQRESKMQEMRKTRASQAVNLFSTSAVEVPNSDSLDSPPNEAPSPVLLLSCMRITVQSKMQRIMNRTIVKKYRNVMLSNPVIEFLNSHY